MNTEWIAMADKPLDQNEMEVIAFHPEWIDADFNPNGTRVGFIGGEGTFISSRWIDYQDTYENDEEYMPTHYMLMPLNPLVKECLRD